ncbi:MAG: ATP-binding protein, partial [Nanoarchaeota archaeon]|nr:ATP-binding protein [Nanoarchaeota archaeon]MBU1030773.1 ATP-binding protein [Nanoarchaeota archaeon]MBU1850505.1 ATP-binding protein [Nanoarchaeota archaeon]
DTGAYIGKLDGKNINVYLNLKKLLTKHVAILAKSGAGKSYAVGVLAEEIIDKKIPLLIIDPHGEYSQMRNPNDEEKESLAKYNLKPKGYTIQEFGDPKVNKGVFPLKLTKDISHSELIHLLPAKLSSTQLGVLYNALKNIDELNFNQLLLELEQDESSAKWSIINVIEYLNNLGIFSDTPTQYKELIRSGVCSIINVKGMPPDIQEIITYKLCKDLFELRKKNEIPPFFMILEEAHNFCPERSFGEKKSSKILRTIASEGRKFGLGLCVISQRPARVDKSVLSQCSTQLIMKVTNPNDLKAISNSVEGINADSEKEIQNLPIGSALVSGIVDIPLFVNIRTRMSKHGGDAVDILDEQKDVLEEIKEFENQEILSIIKPQTTIKDLKLMSEKELEIKLILIPAALVTCQEKDLEFNVLVELLEGSIVVDKETFQCKKLPRTAELLKEEIFVLKKAFAKKELSKEDIIPSIIKKGYIEEQNGKFVLSDKYLFSKISTVKTFDSPEYINIKYDEKKEPLTSTVEVKETLSKFTNIKSIKDCFILKYETFS